MARVLAIDIGTSFIVGAELKGGISVWMAANLPIETKEAPKQAPPEPGALKG